MASVAGLAEGRGCAVRRIRHVPLKSDKLLFWSLHRLKSRLQESYSPPLTAFEETAADEASWPTPYSLVGVGVSSTRRGVCLNRLDGGL